MRDGLAPGGTPHALGVEEHGPCDASVCYHPVSSVVVDMPGYRKAWQVSDNLQPFDAHPEFEENLGHFILGHFRFLHCTKVLIEFIQELCSQCLQLVPQPFLGPRQFVAHRGCARLKFIAERLKTRVQLFLRASCLSMQVPTLICHLGGKHLQALVNSLNSLVQ